MALARLDLTGLEDWALCRGEAVCRRFLVTTGTGCLPRRQSAVPDPAGSRIASRWRSSPA